jgi:hypothetical protein
MTPLVEKGQRNKNDKAAMKCERINLITGVKTGLKTIGGGISISQAW